MIKITDINGRVRYIAATSVSSITEAGTSSQWHGVRCLVKTIEGDVIEAQETASDVAKQVEAQKE